MHFKLMMTQCHVAKTYVHLITIKHVQVPVYQLRGVDRGEFSIPLFTSGSFLGETEYKKIISGKLEYKLFFLYTCTVIPLYTSNRFKSFRLYEMHKLIPVFQFMSQFSLIRAPSSCKPVVVPSASSREVVGN
jgi:hypothetical protein